MRLILVIGILSGLATAPVCAQTDSVPTPAAVPRPMGTGPTVADGAWADTLHWRARHSPRKAVLLSAVLPGAGQIYNRKYWKAPIVWAGLGACVWFVQDNHTQYHRYRDAYLALVDDDPTTMDEFEGRYPAEEVRSVMNTYRNWRDLSYAVTGIVYLLNLVDASVDAHFVRFDVSPELSMVVGPSLPVAVHGGVGFTLGLARR